MANSCGGLIVFGVREAGEFDETYEHSVRSAAITAVSPPLFGLNAHRIGVEGNRVVVVEVAASVDGPHLIYKNEHFGARVCRGEDLSDACAFPFESWVERAHLMALDRDRQVVGFSSQPFAVTLTGGWALGPTR